MWFDGEKLAGAAAEQHVERYPAVTPGVTDSVTRDLCAGERVWAEAWVGWFE